MATQDFVNKLNAQFDWLYQQLGELDRVNASVKSENFKYRDYFSPGLFRCQSTALVDYVSEAKAHFQQLMRYQNKTLKPDAMLGDKLTDQLTALTQIVRANEVALKEQRYRATARKRSKPKTEQYRRAAQFFMQSSHQLHQELAQHHEYERRLAEMIYEREAKLSGANPEQTAQLNKEILALHGRLGKCRRAITGIEEKIAYAESGRFRK